MLTDWGGCLLRCLESRPGNPVIKPLSRAFCKVESGGENRAAWENFTMSAILLGKVTALAWSVGGGSHNGTFHRLVVGHLVPCIMSFPRWEILTLSFKNVTSQSASQNLEIEISDVSFRAGNKWACLASNGRLGRFNSAV